MSKGFSWAGDLCGGAPIVMNGLHVSETCYTGQLVMCDAGIAGAGGHVQIADVASEAHENDQPIFGIVSGVMNENRAYNSTYNGDTCTYTTTIGTIATYGPAAVQVTLVTPMTLIKAPIFDTTYGTALTELTVTTLDAGGATVTHANDTIASIVDDFATIYCRKGANAGQYRVVTTGGANANVVTVPFKYATAVGDVFVQVGLKLGVSRMDIPATANCIDGDAALTNYYDVFVHEINLEESGKEYAVFRFLPIALGPMAA